MGFKNGKVILSMERLKIVLSGKLKKGSESEVDAKHAEVVKPGMTIAWKLCFLEGFIACQLLCESTREFESRPQHHFFSFR